jgi:hypothetical protein
MADPFSPDAFYQSARDFALSALEAHHAGNYRRVPLDAGTALEHLAKASLARRSPALLAELKNDSSIHSVITLLRIEGAGSPASVRTVGLAQALKRVDRFVKSKTPERDLDTLVDMRNGIVHAADDVEVEERILAAFAQHADALLEDLGRDHKDFWGGQLAVVDALLKDASDKLAHRVEVRLAAAEAWLEHRYVTEGKAVMDVVRALSNSAILTHSERFRQCPVCGSHSIAIGEHSVEYEPADWDKDTGEVTNVVPEVWFSARSFRCNVCGLRLDSQAEMDKVFDPVWQIEDADWREYEQLFYDGEDDAYERWREERDEP